MRDELGVEWRLFLAHYAHRAWPGLWRGTRHLYGHTHGTLADTSRSCDAGVDAWDYRPVGIDAIIARQDAATVLPEEIARDSALPLLPPAGEGVDATRRRMRGDPSPPG